MPPTTAPVFRHPANGHAYRYRLTPVYVATGDEVKAEVVALDRNALECPNCWALVREARFVDHVQAVHPEGN